MIKDLLLEVNVQYLQELHKLQFTNDLPFCLKQ